MHNHTIHAFSLISHMSAELEHNVKEWCGNFGFFHINSNGFEMIVYTPYAVDAAVFKLKFAQYIDEQYYA